MQYISYRINNNFNNNNNLIIIKHINYLEYVKISK